LILLISRVPAPRLLAARYRVQRQHQSGRTIFQ
jgi:hypothetical protein